MLQIALDPRFTPTLMGLGAGNAAVEQLQTALKQLAQVSGRPAIDPGEVDGIVGNKTMSAVASALAIIGDKLGSTTKPLLVAALALGGSAPQARDAVTRFASELTIATKAAILKYMMSTSSAAAPGATLVTPSGSSSSGVGPIAVGVPWYKTSWGGAAIAVGGVGLLLLLVTLMRPKQSVTP